MSESVNNAESTSTVNCTNEEGLSTSTVSCSNEGDDGKGAVKTATTANVNIIKSSENVVQAVSTTALSSNQDNVIYVVNKIDAGSSGSSPTCGEGKVMSKPITILGSQLAAGTAILKKGAVMGNTIVKVQKASTQGTSLTKRNVVVTSRPGGGQLITCTPAGQQHSHGSTPVILTQKVATGGSVTSPVVSTGGVNSSITNVSGGAKVVTAAATSPPIPPQQRLQDVRVDNWGNYCLQRLQVMYDKGDYCDLTLRFHSSQEIKVHRVVVNLCTEYFSNLEKLYGLTEGTLILPKDVEFPTMQTIIKFFYTGKLEVRGTQFNDIYRTVKMMNITILIKLLEAHSRKPVQPVKKEAGRSVMLKQAVDLGKGQKGQVQIQVATNTGQAQPASPVIVPVAGSKGLQVAAPGVKLPPGVKTKTVLARVQAQSGKTSGQTATKSAPKKLPIWKERKFTPAPPDPPPQLEKWQIKEEEIARPTRFEWGDPDEFDPFLSSTMTNHALMEKQKERHSARKAEDIFDSVKSQTQSGVKRTQPESNSPSDSTEGASPSAEPPAAKIPKLELQTVKNAEKCVDISTSSADNNANEATNDDSSLEIPENITIEEPTTSAATSEPKTVEKKPVPILKPALKSASKAMGGAGDAKSKETTPQKTVRFAPDIEKENKEKHEAVSPPTTVATTCATSISPTLVISPASNPAKGETTTITAPVDIGDSANHSRIISEILRKYPDLVKDNKNIRLKIVQKSVDSTTSAGASSKETKSKVSYIVLKSTSSGDATSSTVLKKGPAHSSVSKFWETDKTPKKPSPAENTIGPWLCETCGEGENSVLEFDTYYNFRRHLVDVHGERIDARICEYCGQKASKRNLLLYHLYTKHGVQPPKNCTFPHCDRCDYVALSESLLNKHKQNHDVSKEFSCSICNASFKSSSALQSHMSANLHRNKDTKVYECPYCRKPFVRNINLKAHIRSLHRDVARIEEMEDPRLPPDESLKMFSGTGARRRQFPSILAAARGTASSGMVEFVTAESFGDGQSVSYVTADGQPIEIIDPSSLSSLPITLVSSGEDGMAAVATSLGATVDGQQGTSTTEYITGVQDSSQQPMYVMDNSQGAMEIDMSSMGLTLAADGTMVYDGDDASQNFIVQDMQGNQFRRMTGIDETGKPVVFLQMINEGSQVGMSTAVLDESMTVDGNSGNSQMYVSSAGMQIPVSSEGGESQQVIFASAAGDGTILEMVPSDGGSHQVVMGEAVLAAHGQQIEDQQQQHLQLVQHDASGEMQQGIHDEMGQPVQELHIVLDQQENRSEVQDHTDQQEEGMEIVEVQQTEESYGEIELEESYASSDIQQLENAETSVETETSGDGDAHAHSEPEIIADEEGVETQELEMDENSQQLQIDERPHTLKFNSASMDIDSQETQVVTEENLQESIELVEGQTLTLIEEEDGTQTLKVEDSSVEEVTS